VALASGNDVDTGEEVIFAGEPRELFDIALAVREADCASDLPVAEIEAWQVLSVGGCAEADQANP
jgi:hypothetical protein